MSDYIPETEPKQCSKCKQFFPATTEYFMFHTRSQKLYSQCHACRKAAKTASHERNREHNNERAKRWYEANRDVVSQTRKEQYPEKRDEIIARVLKWQKENPDKVQAKNRAYYYRNHERVLELGREAYKRNPDTHRASRKRWRDRNKDTVREKARVYYQQSDYAKAQQRVKAHRRRNAPGSFTAADIRDMYTEQDGRCAYCGVALHGEYHIEHMIPVSRDGTNNPDNLVLACEPCNLDKKDLLLTEWEDIRNW